MALCTTFWQDSVTNFLVSEISRRTQSMSATSSAAREVAYTIARLASSRVAASAIWKLTP